MYGTALQQGDLTLVIFVIWIQSLGWTVDYLQKWYGIAPPELNDSEQKISAALQLLLTGDAGNVPWQLGIWVGPRHLRQ